MVASVLSAAAIAGPIMDGKLPVYPKANLPNGFSFSDPRMQRGMKAGVDPLVLTSSDSAATVDAWYRSRMSWCNRQSRPGTTVYTCGDSFIRIDQKAAGSRIMVIPGESTSKNLYSGHP